MLRDLLQDSRFFLAYLNKYLKKQPNYKFNNVD